MRKAVTLPISPTITSTRQEPKAHHQSRVRRKGHDSVLLHPNFKPDIIDSLSDIGYRGIVIAGTGLGHVNKPLYPALKRAIQKGMTVAMSVQTLWGYAQMYVYDTGRDLLELGVIPLDNMLPETAFMKMSWVLGQTDDPKKDPRDADYSYQSRDHTTRNPTMAI